MWGDKTSSNTLKINGPVSTKTVYILKITFLRRHFIVKFFKGVMNWIILLFYVSWGALIMLGPSLVFASDLNALFEGECLL